MAWLKDLRFILTGSYCYFRANSFVHFLFITLKLKEELSGYFFSFFYLSVSGIYYIYLLKGFLTVIELQIFTNAFPVHYNAPDGFSFEVLADNIIPVQVHVCTLAVPEISDSPRNLTYMI
jgi:hypothetical protein